MIIPFFIPHAGCPHRCVFCDQKRITGRPDAPSPESIPSVIRDHLAGRSMEGPAEVAFYGGSFTALPAQLQRSYLEQVHPFIASGEVSVIRVSTRPDGISVPVLRLLRGFAVTTIELGAQSMDDEVLRRSGRGHTAADTAQAVALLKQEGFRTGIQLMPGLPGDSPAVFRGTVRQVISLRPDLVRLYPALVIAGTPLEHLFRSGAYAPLSLDDAVDLCAEATALFTGAGIGVVRTGLQSGGELEAPGTIAAGPWHPAFGQLVASRILLSGMRDRIGRSGASGPVIFRVNPSDLSTAIGQKRRNIGILAAEHSVAVSFLPDPAVPRGTVEPGPACASAGRAV